MTTPSPPGGFFSTGLDHVREVCCVNIIQNNMSPRCAAVSWTKLRG